MSIASFLKDFTTNPLQAVGITPKIGGTVTPMATSATQTGANLITAAIYAAPKVATKVATSYKALSTTKQLIVGAAAIPVTSAVLSSQKLQSSIVSAPVGLASFGSNVGKLIDNPSVEQAKFTFNQNPVISSIVAGGSAIAVGAGVTGLVSTALNTSAIRANTNATKATSTVQTIQESLPTVANKYAKDIADQETQAAVKIAQINADAQVKLAELQAESAKYATQSSATSANVLGSSPLAVPNATSSPVVQPVVKKKTKKKVKKKKKKKSKPKKKKKPKTIKRKKYTKKKKSKKKKKK